MTSGVVPSGTVPGQAPLLPGRLRPLAVALFLGCVAVIAALAPMVAGHDQPGRLDAPIDSRLQATLGRHPDLVNTLARLGDLGPVALMTALLVVACLATRRWAGAILAAVATPAASVCTEHVLKPAVGRTLRGFLSYPSGHATSMFALALTCVILLPGVRAPRALRLAAAVLALLLAIAVPVAMVSRDLHYFTDIVGGAAVGTATALACALILDRIQDRMARRSAGPLRGAERGRPRVHRAGRPGQITQLCARRRPRPDEGGRVPDDQDTQGEPRGWLPCRTTRRSRRR